MSRHHQDHRDPPAASRLLRAWLQDKFFDAGFFIQKHAGKVLFVGILALVASCAALKSATIETSVDRLWVEGESLFAPCVVVVSMCVFGTLLLPLTPQQDGKMCCTFFTRRQ